MIQYLIGKGAKGTEETLFYAASSSMNVEILKTIHQTGKHTTNTSPTLCRLDFGRCDVELRNALDNGANPAAAQEWLSVECYLRGISFMLKKKSRRRKSMMRTYWRFGNFWN